MDFHCLYSLVSHDNYFVAVFIVKREWIESQKYFSNM